MRPQDLYARPNALAPHYSRFRVADPKRLLLTGHSHQAWPDCSRAGQIQAWDDTAEWVDGKWERAFAKADRVRRGFAALLEDRDGIYALAPNTHELVVRFLSALDLRRRPRLLTTDGEFHSIRRQLDRLAEEGIEVVKIPATSPEVITERLSAEVDDRTAAVLVSAVLFTSGVIVDGLAPLLGACKQHGAELLVDAYHAAGVVPFPLPRLGLGEAFVTGGGYKYCQLGEGNCFLRLPPGCELRPAVTGWYAEFDSLSAAQAGAVAYAEGPYRFAGSTYDPVSHYRAAEVFDFFAEQGLTAAFLREVSQHQVGLLADGFDALDLPPEIVDRDRTLPLERLGGFLALRSVFAGELQAALHARAVRTDHRNHVLRLGPAPYLSDEQLEAALAILGEVVRELAAREDRLALG